MLCNPFNSESRKVYVVSYASVSDFPATGSIDTIYIDDSTNELYRWTGSSYVVIGEYPTVPTYADLPPAALNNGKIYLVTTSTGVWPINRHEAGFYISNGITWTQIPATAGAITYADLYAVSPLTYDGAGTYSTSIATNKLVGRYSALTGVMQEISLDASTLSLSGAGVLSAIAAAPSGAAGGDLSGTYPNPTVAKINGATLGSTTATSGNILIGSGSNWVTRAITGDITIGSTGITAIGANKVTNTMLRQSAGLSVIARSAITAGDVADITAASDFQILSRSGSSIGFSSINLASANAVGTSILPNVNTTATSANTGDAIIARDVNGDFYARKANLTTLFASADGNIQGNATIGTAGGIALDQKLIIRGTASSVLGPHVIAYTASDIYPLYHGLNYAHDNISQSYDAYYDGTNWRSGYSGSNFQTVKTSNQYQFNYASGIAAGSSLTWTTAGFVSSTDGTLNWNKQVVLSNLNSALRFTNSVGNRKIELYRTADNDHQYYGFGINSGVLRYQTDGSSSDHIFYSGINTTTSLELFRVRGTGNIYIPGLTASSVVLTDGSKNLVSATVLTTDNGGTGFSTYALGDTIYSSATNTLSKLAGNITTTKQYLSQTGNGTISAAPGWATISGSDITGAALTKTDDTNVTLTLGGTPATALLKAASLTLGWTGQLSLARGGTNAALTASSGGIFYSTASAGAILAGTATANQLLISGASSAPAWTSRYIDYGTGNPNTKGNLFAGTGCGITGITNNIKNTAFGISALSSILASGTTGTNAAFGYAAGSSLSNAGAIYNTFVGAESAFYLTTGARNTFVGFSTGNSATATTADQCTLIGSEASVSVSSLTNATALGYNAIESESNSITLGNTSVTKIKTTGKIIVTTTAGAQGLDLATADSYANLRVIQNATGADKHIYIGFNGTTPSDVRLYSDGIETMRVSGRNVGMFGAPSAGGGVGVLFIANATTIPTSNPVGGVQIYAQSNAAKVRGGSGTITTFGNAEPHCKVCGVDFTKEFENEKYGGKFDVCLPCTLDAIIKVSGQENLPYANFNGKPYGLDNRPIYQS